MRSEEAGLDEASRIIGLFYDAALEPARWNDALEASAGWVRPQGFVDFVGVNLQRYASSSACFVVRRGDHHGYVDESARRRLALLAPMSAAPS